MKLKLEAVRDVNVLVATGPIEPANFAVLKAGIRKLFKDGKNKIILELPESSTLSPEILRELAALNLLASELAGQILLAGISPLTRAKIDSFSKPPVVRCFADRTAAVEFFHPKAAEEPAKKEPPKPDLPSDAKPAAAATPSATPAGAAPEAAGHADPASMKSEIRSKEIGDLGELRKRMTELEAENRELMAELSRMATTRREPPDLDSWKEKVSRLEKDLADAIAAAQAPPPKK
jgi:hypothetical protein